MTSRIDKASRQVYRLGRGLRNLRAVERSVETGSPMPLVKRLARIWLGRQLGKTERRIGL